jgi:general secretion pathway protein K
MTIWVIIFLTIAAMSFSLSTRWSLASTHNFRQETEAYYVALSGVDMARNYLMNDTDPRIDYIDEKGVFYVDKDHEPLGDNISLYSGTVEINITDEQARINLNRTNQRNLRKLLQYAGVEQDKEDAYVDCLLDWIDADDAHHLNGAEDEYYEDLGYKSKNGPLDTVEELLLVKEYSEELLYGSDDYTALYPLVTTFGDGTFNVNTADAELMSLLGVSEIDIENVMRYRDSESGGLSSVPSGLRSFGFTTTFSRYVRVTVSAEVKESGIKYLITAVIKRIPDKDGYRLETVFWREDVKYS